MDLDDHEVLEGLNEADHNSPEVLISSSESHLRRMPLEVFIHYEYRARISEVRPSRLEAERKELFEMSNERFDLISADGD